MEGFGERERKPERQEPWGGSPYLWCVRAQWWSEIGLEMIFFLMCCFDLLFFVHLFLIFSVLLFKVLISGKLNTLSLVAQLKEAACNAGDLGSIPRLGRSPGEGKDYPLQYSGLENSRDCRVHGVAKNRTQLSDFHFTVFRFLYSRIKRSKMVSQKNNKNLNFFFLKSLWEHVKEIILMRPKHWFGVLFMRTLQFTAIQVKLIP